MALEVIDWIREIVCMKKINQQIVFVAVCTAALIAISTKVNAACQGVVSANSNQVEAEKLLAAYCFDCHGEGGEGGVNLVGLLEQDSFDGTLLFENLITSKMPPSDMEQPSVAEKQVILKWLAERQDEVAEISFRRISRHEFVHSANDLLGTNLDLASEIPEDRGTNDFDSDRRIQLSKEQIASYFMVADKMVEHAFPVDGFPQEQIWITNKLKDSHETYNIYVRDYKDGTLLSWTRANNGNSYSFFYDNFEPPAAGWYDLTFDAMKVGEFEGDVSVQVHAGKYYYADDRPQPQRLLDVISLGNRQLESHSVRVFLNPGENVSVHCYSKHTYRKKNPNQGAYIKQLKVRGPIQNQWPPKSYPTVFGELPLKSSPKPAQNKELEPTVVSGFQSNLKKIGGNLTVSSFQKGMEKEKMQDGSNRTFWHTRFEPSIADSPHFVILENPRQIEIEGLSYATWSGGNGNGQVQKFSVFASDDGKTWGDPIVEGDLEIRLANEQPIHFTEATTKRFIKFLITDSFSLDGRSLASIGKLDVVVGWKVDHPKNRVIVDSNSSDDLKRVIRRFSERAFSSNLSDYELESYFGLGLWPLAENQEFSQAAKVALKAMILSPRFVMGPGKHSSLSHSKIAALARILWLSVPDDELIGLANLGSMSDEVITAQIDRMLNDKKSDRMIESFCEQWLNLRSWRTIAPSLKLYPEYDDLLNYYLPMETTAYLRYLIQEDLPVGNLIDSNFSILNQRLAEHYGIEGVVGQQMRKVSFSSEVPRGGLLTMGSVLKVTTDGFDTSPILRGAWISKNIVGTPLSPPPEEVKAIEPEHGKTAASLREQIERHKSSPACYACHKSIDPYGFALENFDATGGWRTKYRVEKPHRGTFQFRLNGYYDLAQEVDASGEIGNQEFGNIFGLKQVLLLDHKKVAYNFAKKVFEFANGYKPTLKQRMDLFNLIENDPDDCRVRGLINKVVVYSLAGEEK